MSKGVNYALFAWFAPYRRKTPALDPHDQIRHGT